MNPEIAEIYGNKVRMRVSGLYWRDDALLMIKHRMGDQDLWAPPGGGIEFGEFLEDTLKREFLEETGLSVIPGKFLFGCEFVENPLHAIELFFDVTEASGAIQSGEDPELQIIECAQFLTPGELERIPRDSLHGILRKFASRESLNQLSGFYRI
jgi:8-oxo-dGTP diphosphatase